MNSIVTFPVPPPELKLPRASAEKWAATLAEERRRLAEDQEALREREANLRDYEARLRAWQAEIEAGRGVSPARAQSAVPASGATTPAVIRPSQAPFHPDDPALKVGWEKMHRARELLEAEQVHLRDDRIAIREQEVNLKKREELVTAREQMLKQREAAVAAAMPELVARAAKAGKKSKLAQLTQAPFDMARSVFGAK